MKTQILLESLVVVALIAIICMALSCIDSHISTTETIQANVHQYLRFKNRGGAVHDPDCPCQHKTPEAE